MKKYHASISIYFVFAITLIISVIMSVTEIARINCQKLYLQIATDASLDSMASLYHRNLYEYYSLYGVEYKTKEMLETEYLSYLEPFFTDGETYLNNWYIAEIDEEHIDLSYKTLVEEENLEKEIINFMKLKIIGNALEFLGKKISINDEDNLDNLVDTVDDLHKEIDKCNIYGEAYDRYFDFANDIKELEESAKQISSFVDKVNIKLNGIKSMSISGTLNNGKSLLNKMKSLTTDLDSLKNALKNYKIKMQSFKNKVMESRDRYVEDRDSGTYEFTDDVCKFIESEFDRFIGYVDEYSEMNEKIDEGIENSDTIRRIVDKDHMDIDSYVQELIDIEEEIKSESKLSGEDRDEDYISDLKDTRNDMQDEFSDYLKDLKDTYKDYKFERIEIVVSTSSHKTEENLLDKLIGLKKGIALNLVLDSDEVNKLSSDNVPTNSFNILSGSNSLSIEKILLGEYEIDKFNYYSKEKKGEVTKSGSENYEVERLIVGKNFDLDNIKGIINKILFMRIGFNVLHIYTHSDKREMVRSFTIATFSGFSPLLAEAMFLVVLTAWGTAQALVDVKKLMSGKKVSLLHTDSTWSVSLSSIFDIARNGVDTTNDTDDNGFAFDYKDYLRLLLITTKQSDINSRMAGIIEYNLKRLQSNFDFNKSIYSFDVKNDFICKHFFTNFIFVQAKDIILPDRYKIPITSYRSFYD